MSETLEEKYQYMCELCEEYASRLAEIPATSIETIVRDIIAFTDSTEDAEALNDAWSRVSKALGYLSAKDTMFKYRREIKEE